MRQIGLLFIVSTLLLSQQACRSRQQTDSQPTDSTRIAAEAVPSADEALTDHLIELGLTTDSDWRGISIGDEFSRVKATEKGEAFENDATHIGYTVEFKNLETADMLYYQTNQKVSAINVDLFLNSRNSVDTYQKELTTYFSARYGTPKPGDGGTVWTGQSNKTIALTDVSKGKDFGLKIKISPTSGATAASVK